MTQRSLAYADLYLHGPFAGSIDPWSEDDTYFHQLHGAVISEVIQQISRELFQRGYLIGRERSLQITERRQPDIYVAQREPRPVRRWDFVAVAEAAALDPGLLDWDKDPPDAIAIYQRQGHELVTVVELVSPGNKRSEALVESYKLRRSDLLAAGVQVVEIDLTRSIKRLHESVLTAETAYHIALHFPYEARVIALSLYKPLPRFALPLREDVIGVDLTAAYTAAYTNNHIAAQILDERAYAADALPFPTLLNDAQRDRALQAVAAWQARLSQLALLPPDDNMP